MKTIDYEKVESIASMVREGVEYFASDRNDEVCGDADNLSCYCAIASHALHIALKKRGIKSRIVIGYYDIHENGFMEDEADVNHCWVEVEKKMIDITASQFPQFHNEKVVVFDSSKCNSQGFYPIKEFKSLTDMRKEWGESQRPRLIWTKEILERAFDIS